MDIRVYTDALDLLEKEIRKLTMKGEISATELVNLREAVTAACKIVEMVGELPEDKAEGKSSSYAVTPGFRSRGRTEGFNDGYSAGYHDGHSAGYHDGASRGTEGQASYQRGRSSETGRYTSRGPDTYSGHSIHDRMVAKLEEMYDGARSEHERKAVDTAIRMIEQNK